MFDPDIKVIARPATLLGPKRSSEESISSRDLEEGLTTPNFPEISPTGYWSRVGEGLEGATTAKGLKTLLAAGHEVLDKSRGLTWRRESPWGSKVMFRYTKVGSLITPTFWVINTCAFKPLTTRGVTGRMLAHDSRTTSLDDAISTTDLPTMDLPPLRGRLTSVKKALLRSPPVARTDSLPCFLPMSPSIHRSGFPVVHCST